MTSSVQSGSSVLLWNCGDVTSSNASGSWASQYAPARTAMITTTAFVDAGRQIAAWLDRTLRDNDQADADVQYIQSIAAPETQLAVAVTQRENQHATSSTNTSNDLNTDLDTSGSNIQSTSAAIEKSSAVDSATAWKAYQVALASLDEGAATTAVDKAYQDALAHVTRNSRVAYANLTYTEGVAQVGSVADAITELGQASKTHVTNLADDEKTYTDTAAPIIGARTLLYTEADNDLRKAITTADNVWRNNTAQAWGTHTAGDLVARGNVRRSLANTSNLIADASQASIAELKAQWWQNEIPNYLQWSVDIGGIETTYTNSTTANILLRTTGVKNAGITYASTVGTAIKAYETTTATARELYLSTLMTISETAAEATMRADRDKEIALADADLQKQLTGNESAHTTAVNNANSAHSTATANAEAARKSAEQAALTQLNSTLAQATKDKESAIAGAERTYDQTVASLDAQYGSASSNGDTGVEGATRRSAIKTRDAQYYAARDTSWANTLSGSTTLGTTPWTVKAITAANAEAAFSTSRASAQAAHDAAMLDAIEDWQDATSTATLTKLAAQANGSEVFSNAVSNAFGNWEEFLGNYSTFLPDELVLTENATVSFSPEEPIVQSPNIPIPGGPDELGNSTPRSGELPGRPLPNKRSWITGEGTWLSSPDDPTTEDRTWWQFGGEMARTAFELTPGWQFNELIQSANERYGKPGLISELAHGIDGSTHNVFNVFSFGASDYVGATDSESFHYDSDGNATVFYYQSGIFTISRELLMLYGTMSVRAALLGSKGFGSGSSIAQSLWSNLGPRNLQLILRADMAYHAVQTVQGALALPADIQTVYNNPTSFQAWWGLGTNTTITALNIFGLKVAAGSKIQGFDKLTKQAPNTRLTHLTTKDSHDAITQSSEDVVKIGGKWGIFALDAAKVPLSRFWRSFNTFVPYNLTHQIDIPAGAVSAFKRPFAWGPVSAYRRWIAGVQSTPLGSIDLNTGTFVRGEIFKNGVFRQATRGEWIKYYGHQFVLDYGIDAGIYGIAGLGTIIYVGEQGIIDSYNWLRGDRR